MNKLTDFTRDELMELSVAILHRISFLESTVNMALECNPTPEMNKIVEDSNKKLDVMRLWYTHVIDAQVKRKDIELVTLN